MIMTTLKKHMIKFAQSVRAPLMRIAKPLRGYFLYPAPTLQPLSSKFGFDRGTPVDRYYIEKFLSENAQYISGTCLEIHDTHYVDTYGHDVIRKDSLDVDPKNTQVSIHADLRSMPHVPSATYDCIVLTHTLGVIDDYEAAIRECKRILKPGGHILATVSAVGVAQHLEYSYWRFTSTSLGYLFKKYFSDVKVSAFGNVLSGQAFWVGMAAEELSKEQLDAYDSRYQVIVGVVAKP